VLVGRRCSELRCNSLKERRTIKEKYQIAELKKIEVGVLQGSASYPKDSRDLSGSLEGFGHERMQALALGGLSAIT